MFPALVTPACHRQSAGNWCRYDDAHITRVQMCRAVADDVFANGIVFFFDKHNGEFVYLDVHIYGWYRLTLASKVCKTIGSNGPVMSAGPKSVASNSNEIKKIPDVGEQKENLGRRLSLKFHRFVSFIR